MIKAVHPFPARMGPDLAIDRLKRLKGPAIVLDPMAGSGTVLRHAAERGHTAVGRDLDPLAVLMARVWTTPGRVSVGLGDARALEDIGDGTVDVVLSSPPYLNAIDYMRGHRMSLVWLGHRVGELRAIRADSVGSERGPDAPQDSAQVDPVL